MDEPCILRPAGHTMTFITRQRQFSSTDRIMIWGAASLQIRRTCCVRHWHDQAPHWFPIRIKSVPTRRCPSVSSLSTSTLPLILSPSCSLTLSPWNTFMTRSAENRITFMSADHPTCAPIQKTGHRITSLLLKSARMMLHWMLLPLIIWDEGSNNDMFKCTSIRIQNFFLVCFTHLSPITG